LPLSPDEEEPKLCVVDEDADDDANDDKVDQASEEGAGASSGQKAAVVAVHRISSFPLVLDSWHRKTWKSRLAWDLPSSRYRLG
jgi:hypothetical protein